MRQFFKSPLRWLGGDSKQESSQQRKEWVPDKTTSSLRRAREPKNVFSHLTAAQTYCPGMRRASQMPSQFIAALDKRSAGVTALILHLEVAEQEMARGGRGVDGWAKARTSLQSLLAQFSEASRFEQVEGYFGRVLPDGHPRQHPVDQFVSSGGVAVVLRMLQRPEVVAAAKSGEGHSMRDADLIARTFPVPSLFQNSTTHKTVLTGVTDILSVLQEVVLLAADVAADMSCDDAFVHRLFALMESRALFGQAVALAEKVLDMRDDVFPIATVPDLAEIVSGFTGQQLASFCRVAALVVFDQDDYMYGDSLKTAKEVHRIACGAAPASTSSTSESSDACCASSSPSPPSACLPQAPMFSAPPSVTLQMRRRKRMETARTIDRNQAVLLGIPDFVLRLLKILSVESFLPVPLETIATLPTNTIDTLDILSRLLSFDSTAADDWFASINLVRPSVDSDDSDADSDEDGEDYRAQLSAEYAALPSQTRGAQGEPASGAAAADGAEDGTPAAAGRAPPAGLDLVDIDPATMRMITMAMYHVEVLFVVCTLLGGRRKVEVQALLARLGAIPVLSRLFDKLEWTKTRSRHMEVYLERMHGPNCECSPDSALKIQYLRLLHNLCDNMYDPGVKRLLLTRSEVTAIESIERGCTKSGAKFADHLRCDGRSGLLVKAARTLMRLSPDSPYRFWMSSSIESYLRGATVAERILLSRTGLMKHTIDDLLSDAEKKSGVLQSNFDLLGELMKFAPDMFALFNQYITDAEFAKIAELMSSNIVDSNVFVRAMIVSVEHFSQLEKQGKLRSRIYPYDPATCRISTQLSTRALRLRLLGALMNAVSIDDLNQENICCINTAVILLVYARRYGELADYLDAFAEAESSTSAPHKSSLANFRELLTFWNVYYLSRGRDCRSLEHSSLIPFTEWRDVIDTLLGDGELSLSRRMRAAA